MVGILIVFYNSEKYVNRLLNSIKKQKYKDYKIYAIDTSASLHSITILRKEFPNSIIIPCEVNLGFAKANNLLSHYAINDGCKYLLVLNPDMELTENTLEVLVDILDNEHDVAACSCIILYGYNKIRENIIQLFGQEFNYRTQSKNFLFAGQPLDSANIPEKIYVDFVNGGSLLIRSDIVKQIGLFNESYFMYNDEIDLAYRIKGINKKVVVTSKTKIYHHHDWTKKNKISYYIMYYYMMRNRVLFFKKNKFFLNLIFDLLLQVLTLPVKIKWLTKLADLKLVKYYYLGLLRGLLGETGKTESKLE